MGKNLKFFCEREPLFLNRASLRTESYSAYWWGVEVAPCHSIVILLLAPEFWRQGGEIALTFGIEMMFVRILPLLCLTLSPMPTMAKLLDKIVAVVNDRTYTLSQVERRITNIDARRQISPFIYKAGIRPTLKSMVETMVNQFFIKEHLTTLGYTVGDSQVERQIQETQRRLGLTRSALLQFLQNNRMTFDEYFELIRETIEFQLFQERVISPLISITDQEVKNEYYKNNKSNRMLSFNLSLVGFSLAKAGLNQNDVKKLPSVFKTFQETGNLPERFSKVQASDLGVIKEDGLEPRIQNAVKNVQEGQFSPAIAIGNDYHVFFVKKRDIVESDDFLRVKNRLTATLYMQRSESALELWFEREMAKYYVRYFL